MWSSIIIAALTAYMLGNLNGAFLAGHRIAGEDIRKKGSGNAGLTNFIRNYGASSAITVVLTDMGKAILACLVGGAMLAPFGHEIAGRALGGLFVILGHAFPALLGFRGGKGILSGVTVGLCLDWRIGLGVFAIFHWDQKFAVAVGFFLSALLVWMHRENIKRLLRGQERKTNLFGKGKQK